MAQPTLYDLAKIAFREVLDFSGVDITFAGNTKKCISQRIKDQLPWQGAGFLPDKKVEVDMIDDDFDEFIGIDGAQAQVILDWDIFLIEEIDRSSGDPIVKMWLTLDK